MAADERRACWRGTFLRPALVVRVLSVLITAASAGYSDGVYRQLAGAVHMHSTFSTGRETIEEIAERAVSLGIDALIITDDDLLKVEYGLPFLRGLPYVRTEPGVFTHHSADVGIVGDQISAIGELGSEPSRNSVAAAGKVVAPGFVDTHNHSDGWLLKQPHLVPKTRQGFTTEVIMSDGISYAPVNEHTAPEWMFYMRSLNALLHSEYDGWLSLADYMSRIDGNSAQNAITQIPYANLRTMACGFGRGAPDDVQMRDIRAAVEQGMAEGAVGLSTGLDYISQCYASTDELVEVCAAMSPQKGIYATHMRYKKGTLPALKEAVEIGRRADVPVHISHLKSADPQEAQEILA